MIFIINVFLLCWWLQWTESLDYYKVNTNMAEKIHCLCPLTQILFEWHQKTLSTKKKQRERKKKRKKKKKRSSCCRKSSWREIRQKVDLSIPKDCFSSCVNRLQFARSHMNKILQFQQKFIYSPGFSHSRISISRQSSGIFFFLCLALSISKAISPPKIYRGIVTL